MSTKTPKKTGGKSTPRRKKMASTRAARGDEGEGGDGETFGKLEAMNMIADLELEVSKEREERNYFQLERDRINAFWEVTKKELEAAKGQYRQKDRLMEEQEEKHEMEIKVYKQRLKSILYEQQNSIVQLKQEGEQAILHEQEDHVGREHELRKGQRALKLELKDLELSHEQIVKTLKVENDKIVSRLRSDFERQLSEMHKKYEEKMDQLRHDLDTRRKAEIMEIEERKNRHIQDLMRNHEHAFLEMKNYYQEITHSNLDLIKVLKDEVAELRKKETAADKRYVEVMQENKRLVEPLQRARKETEELQKQLASYEKDKLSLAHAKSRLSAITQERQRLEWEHEILEQKHEKLQQDRDDLYDKLVKSVYDSQQKAGFKNLLLERKLGAAVEEFEKKDAQLGEVIRASNLDPQAYGAVTQKLEDVLESKNQAIKELRYELDKVTKAHNDIIRVYEAKLAEFGIPPEELGFQPLDTRTSSLPAGLIS